MPVQRKTNEAVTSVPNGFPVVPAATPVPVLSISDAAPAAGWQPKSDAGPVSNLRFRPRMNESDRLRQLQALETATPLQLNGVLGPLTTHDWRAALGTEESPAILRLVCTRLGELTLDTRAKVIRSLHQLLAELPADGEREPVTPNPSIPVQRYSLESTIGAVFSGTTGPALTELKNRIDGATDRFDLQQLVFRDIETADLRSALLKHFQTQAGAPGDAVKVFSDIDDTFYVNWVDDRFPKKTVYPGVRAFYEELDKGAAPTPDRLGDLMFLSARPYDSAGFLEHRTRSMLAGHGVTQATVLSGDFLHLVGNENIAKKKFSNWEEMRQLYPEYGSVFIGDSGQGDGIFGARATATERGLRASYIHNVTHLGDEAKAAYAKEGQLLFDTYVGAATRAFQEGLIGRAGLMRVIGESAHELSVIPFADPAQQAARQSELTRDIELARDAMNAASR